MDRFGQFVGRLGGKLGIGVCLLGFLLIYLGWNGAGSFNDLRQQFPYLISGGIAGLGLVIVGAALLVIESTRAERAELQTTLLELRDALASVGSSTSGAGPAPSVVAPEGSVVAGASSYHRPTCRLVQGRADLDVLPASEADGRGLKPCRICRPDGLPGANAVANGAGSSRLSAT